MSSSAFDSRDADFTTRWRAIKALFPRALPVVERSSSVQQRRGERGITDTAFRWGMRRNAIAPYEAGGVSIISTRRAHS